MNTGNREEREIWRKALANMPAKKRVTKHNGWYFVNRPVPIGEYIKKNVHGSAHMLEGKVQFFGAYTTEETYGEIAALTRALGFHKPTCKGSCLCHNRVCTGRDDGTIIRDNAQRKLLHRLAGPNGRKHAAKLLGRV